MQIYLGSLYVNDFNRFGRTYQVIAQAEPGFPPARPTTSAAQDAQCARRDGAARQLRHRARDRRGPTAPCATTASLPPISTAAPAPGYCTGQAQEAIEELAQQQLPNGMRFEWTELTYQQILAGNTALFVFPLCVLLVFLVLAAQYESAESCRWRSS